MPIRTPDPATLNSLVSDQNLFGGATAEWWRRQSRDFRQQFADAMRVSMRNGESVTQGITRVVGGTVDGVQIPGFLKQSKARAGALVSSAMNSVSNQASLATYQANTDVIKAVQQVSTLDNRTSDVCIAYSGKVWNVATLEPIDQGDGTLPFNGGPPRHFNCRSKLVPVTKSFRELGFNRDEIAPGTRASMDGQVPGDITFDRWLKGKNATFQNRVLGTVRARLWRKGEITLTQLVDMRGNPLTTGALLERVGLGGVGGLPVSAVVPKPPPAPKTPEVPVFKNKAEAEQWIAANVVDQEFYKGVRRTIRTRRKVTEVVGPIGWLGSYDPKGMTVVARVQLWAQARFGKKLPNYIGNPRTHPRYRIRWNNKHLAAVVMQDDSLLFLGNGVDIKKNAAMFAREAKYVERHNWSDARKAQFLDEAKTFDDPALVKAIEHFYETQTGAFTIGWEVEEGARKVALTFIHELGHRLHAQFRKEIDTVLAEIRLLSPKHRFAWKRQVSEYGMSNDKEFVAESFVHYVRGDHVRVHPKLLAAFKKLDKGGGFGDEVLDELVEGVT